MGNRLIRITDCSVLSDLQAAYNDFSTQMQDLLANIEDYLQSCTQGFDETMRQLQEQRNQAQERLDKAKERHTEAQSNLSSCECRQRWVKDDEGNEYLTPSCAAQQAAVTAAFNKVKECEEKVRKIELKIKDAQVIINETEAKIEDYHHVGGIITPHGGYKTMEILSGDYSKEATEKLNKIIEWSGEYLGRDVVERTYSDNTTESSLAERPDEGSERIRQMQESKPDKADLFRQAAGRISERQQSEALHNNVAEPDIVHVCPGCHRPINVCICNRLRERFR